MPLTDADKVIAKQLGLTLDEMRMAKATHIAPERYAHHKAATCPSPSVRYRA